MGAGCSMSSSTTPSSTRASDPGWLSVHGAKLRLHFLPPYCQKENRIERLWLTSMPM